MKKEIFAIICFVFLSTPAWAQTPEAAFYEGNRLYSEGKYAEAVQKYQEIVSSGYENAALYYNLGNGHVKLGEKGKAILYYEKARLRAPRDQELLYNLSLIQSQLEDRVTPQPQNPIEEKCEKLIDRFSEPEWLALFVAGYLAAFSAAVAWLFWLRRRKLLSRIFFALFVAWVLSGVGLLCKGHRVGWAGGVVLAPQVEARYGPSEKDVAAFTLHEGTTCRILGRRDNWVQIKLADGKIAWLPESAVEKI